MFPSCKAQVALPSLLFAVGTQLPDSWASQTHGLEVEENKPEVRDLITSPGKGEAVT